MGLGFGFRCCKCRLEGDTVYIKYLTVDGTEIHELVLNKIDSGSLFFDLWEGVLSLTGLDVTIHVTSSHIQEAYQVAALREGNPNSFHFSWGNGDEPLLVCLPPTSAAMPEPAFLINSGNLYPYPGLSNTTGLTETQRQELEAFHRSFVLMSKTTRILNVVPERDDGPFVIDGGLRDIPNGLWHRTPNNCDMPVCVCNGGTLNGIDLGVGLISGGAGPFGAPLPTVTLGSTRNTTAFNGLVNAPRFDPPVRALLTWEYQQRWHTGVQVARLVLSFFDSQSRLTANTQATSITPEQGCPLRYVFQTPAPDASDAVFGVDGAYDVEIILDPADTSCAYPPPALPTPPVTPIEVSD